MKSSFGVVYDSLPAAGQAFFNACALFKEPRGDAWTFKYLDWKSGTRETKLADLESLPDGPIRITVYRKDGKAWCDTSAVAGGPFEVPKGAAHESQKHVGVYVDTGSMTVHSFTMYK